MSHQVASSDEACFFSGHPVRNKIKNPEIQLDGQYVYRVVRFHCYNTERSLRNTHEYDTNSIAADYIRVFVQKANNKTMHGLINFHFFDRKHAILSRQQDKVGQ